MQQNVYIGVDIGGTNIKSALVNDQGQILKECKIKTEAFKGFSSTVKTLFTAIETLVQEAQQCSHLIKGIGIGCPGIINSETGVIVNLTNMPGWQDKPLAQMIEENFHIKTKIDNDLNVYTLGEQCFGKGQGVRNFLCIALGTGVGGGIVIDGKLVRGSTMSAGEIGHMVLLPQGGDICGCGNFGCLESLGSEIAIIRRANRQISGGGGRKIREMIGKGELNAQVVFEAAQAGDAEAKTILREAGEWVGHGLATLANILNPELIIIGGGVSNAGEFIMKPLQESMGRQTLPYIYHSLRIEVSELKDRAGVLGATALFSEC